MKSKAEAWDKLKKHESSKKHEAFSVETIINLLKK